MKFHVSVLEPVGSAWDQEIPSKKCQQKFNVTWKKLQRLQQSQPVTVNGTSNNKGYQELQKMLAIKPVKGSIKIQISSFRLPSKS